MNSNGTDAWNSDVLRTVHPASRKDRRVCGNASEFVDGVQLLVHRLNTIEPALIGDRAHIAIWLIRPLLETV
ncbi:uncharacterized protein N7496_010659 [Penicillium cataractarum]|uniref:Uncharacterized protein n=1 Tax=Penicillium cataractarum TaxID=2100454 RepID=A0A9W9V3K2_9EURO|nr:uncharacterized protein N7496_010659 [Penicillium cataractarum]KAJ5364946.1 hypothetical protein N7496_010659 [Penicillium cataractarum]